MLLTPPDGSYVLPNMAQRLLHVAQHKLVQSAVADLLCAPPLFVRALQARHQWVPQGSAILASQHMALLPVPL